MAVNRGGQDSFNQLAGGVASLLAKQVTEIGSAIGLAPPEDEPADGTPPPPTPPPPPQPAPESGEAGGDPIEIEPEEPRPLPIARYDELTAKEIIGLLDDLDPGELDRIRAHEEANRARKTVFGKLDRLSN